MNTTATIAFVTVCIVAIVSIVVVFYMAHKNVALKSTIERHRRLYRSELEVTPTTTSVTLQRTAHIPDVPKKHIRTLRQRFLDNFM